MWKELTDLGWTALIALALTLAFIAAALPSHAGGAYRYTAANGTVSFTDSADKVPPMYQEQAQQVELAELGTYERLTISAPARYSSRIARLRREQAIAAEWAQRVRAVRIQWERALTLPFHATREMRWVEGVLGYSGNRYVAVDVLRDARGRTIATGLSEIGLGPAALVAGGLR